MAHWLATGGLLAVAGCSLAPPQPVHSSGHDSSPSLPSASALDVERLAKTDDCADCHIDVASHWMHSAHAYASFDNPWYRASIDQFRAHRSNEESRFCAGCHDPLLLVAGDIDGEVEPDDELAYAGITCLVCHSIESARPDGNGSFTLTSARVLIPDPASPEEIEEHRTRLTMQPLRTAALCGSCHRSFSGPAIGNENHLPGIDDLGDWTSSAFAGAVQDQLLSVEERSCQDCHMGIEGASKAEMAAALDGEVRSHRWSASHTAMAAQFPDAAHLRQARKALEGAVIVDIGAVRAGARDYVLPEESRIRGGEILTFHVLLQNERAGHRFPGGARDMQDVWVEVEVRDANGSLLGVSRPSEDGDDAFVLRATVLDAMGNPETLHRVHRFSASAFDRTLSAQDARAVRYSITLPHELALPLRVDAKLLHRKHSRGFQAVACQASRSPRGVGFALGAAAHGKVPLDPCVEQPVTEVGAATVWMGRGAADRLPTGGGMQPLAERLLTQALALLHGTQEHVHLALPSIERALSLAREADSPALQARALILRARVSSIEGRPNEAVAFTRQAEALVGPNPVLDRVRADAYAGVWRWKEAAEAYQRVADASPLDWHAWQDLAQAYGSSSDDFNALSAADAGLRLAPRNESLLRSRALALAGLGRPDAGAARDRWLAHRVPDAQPRLLSTCEQTHERCSKDRQPIPHYTLSPVRKAVHARVDPR